MASEMVGSGYAAASETVLTDLEDFAGAQSAVSWGAVFAGGVSGAAIGAILLLFGAGFGLAAISPWPHAGLSATGFTVVAAIWLIIVQWISSFVGGYMSGRLRTKWTGLHTDEVLFRDTAHGFLAWALGVLLMVLVLTLGAGAAASNGARAAASLAAQGHVADNYYVSLLFRPAPGGTPTAPGISAPGVSPEQIRTQAGTILAEGALQGGVPPADQTYLAQLVQEQTGLAPADAKARVTEVVNREQADLTKAKQVADAGRKTASATALYGFLSLLIGAFIASVAGAIGGRLRDKY